MYVGNIKSTLSMLQGIYMFYFVGFIDFFLCRGVRGQEKESQQLGNTQILATVANFQLAPCVHSIQYITYVIALDSSSTIILILEYLIVFSM